MKKILAVILAAVLALGSLSALAEQAAEGKYDKLTVGVTTPFNGNFFSEILGNNVSDQDVRRLIYDYSPVTWNPDTGIYEFDTRVVSAATLQQEGGTYTFALNREMAYNDGTPITARDYAFSLLLQLSPELREAAGVRRSASHLVGAAAYSEGSAKVLSGVRVMGDYMLSLTLDPSYSPYFYELKALDVIPMPIGVLAPGCEVRDDGEGVYLSGNFSADLLKKTLLDPATGYMSHPAVTSGPYALTGYEENKVSLVRNENYLGNADGTSVQIPAIDIRYVNSDLAVSELSQGAIDLLVRCTRRDQITNGIRLAQSGDFGMQAYSRNGLGFISFCAEKGPTADVRVRQALNRCMNQQALIDQYLGAYGTEVYGYYGVGQWMFLMANGTLIPNDEEEAKAWEGLNLEGLTRYDFSTEEAAKLLEEAGWNLNAQGQAFNPETDSLRYSNAGGTLVPLTLSLIYPENNAVGTALQAAFTDHLNAIGVGLSVEQVPMETLLQKYYGQAERDCDMILLGTNFGDVFDPSTDYSADGTVNRLNGIDDANLAKLCRELRQTEPGDTAGYCRKWIAMQEYRTAIATEIPLYSNAYLDFHIQALRNYHPQTTSSWSTVITSAYLSDYAPEETEGEAEDEFGI